MAQVVDHLSRKSMPEIQSPLSQTNKQTKIQNRGCLGNQSSEIFFIAYKL